MNESRESIRVVGELMEEIFERRLSAPKPNETIVVPRTNARLGGPVVNVSWFISELGLPVDLVTYAGADEVLALAGLFPSHNVSVSRIAKHHGSVDLLVAILFENIHQSVYLLGDVPATGDEYLIEQCQGARTLILNGGRHVSFRRAYRRLVVTGSSELSTIFNPSYAIYEYSRDELITILSHCTILVVNASEYEYLTSKMAGQIPGDRWMNDDQYIIVTKGREGVEVKSARRTKAVTSKIDRPGLFLGAGDAFTAGVAYGRQVGYDIDHTVEIGLWLAATVVETGMVRVSDVLSRLPPELFAT